LLISTGYPYGLAFYFVFTWIYCSISVSVSNAEISVFSFFVSSLTLTSPSVAGVVSSEAALIRLAVLAA
jgi:hypothetical protein